MRAAVLIALLSLAPLSAGAGGTAVAEALPSGRPAATAPPAVADGLAVLMVDRPGCPWCATFRREILPRWSTTPQGRAMPLHVVQLDGPWPDGLAIAARPHLTPTFIVLRDRREVARIEGYPGARYFWGELVEVMRAAGIDPPGR